MSITLSSISSHENKKALSSFYHKKIFLIESECKTPYGCHLLSKIFFMIK